MIIKFVLSSLARLPLLWWHGVGVGLAWLAYGCDRHFRQRLQHNLAQAHHHVSLVSNSHDYSRLRRQCIAEIGKGALELVVAWGRAPVHLMPLVRKIHGEAHWAAALARGKGVLCITPHLGCYDLGGRYLAKDHALMAMYRPSRQTWLEPLMSMGRDRGRAVTVPADMRGVRSMLQHLKKGGVAMILPDQVPTDGDGVWADFFGKPAYTMTLAARLATATDAAVVWFYLERLSWGRGYHLHFFEMPSAFSADKVDDAHLTNQMVEQWVVTCPSQSLWSYNRDKQPRARQKVEPA